MIPSPVASVLRSHSVTNTQNMWGLEVISLGHFSFLYWGRHCWICWIIFKTVIQLWGGFQPFKQLSRATWQTCRLVIKTIASQTAEPSQTQYKTCLSTSSRSTSMYWNCLLKWNKNTVPFEKSKLLQLFSTGLNVFSARNLELNITHSAYFCTQWRSWSTNPGPQVHKYLCKQS